MLVCMARVFLLGRLLPKQRKQAPSWEQAESLREQQALLSLSRSGLNMLSSWHGQTAAILLWFFLILFPVCAWVVSGKRGRGKSTASLIEIHNGHHNLLRSMTEKGWCLYGSACYLPWTIPPSCDCTCTHYKMESESCHFFENNVNGSGLFFWGDFGNI